MLISNVYFFDGSVGLPAMPVTILMSGSVVPKVTTKHMVQSGPLEEAIKMKSPKLGYCPNLPWFCFGVGYPYGPPLPQLG